MIKYMLCTYIYACAHERKSTVAVREIEKDGERGWGKGEEELTHLSVALYLRTTSLTYSMLNL